MAKRNRRHEIMQAAEAMFTSRRFHEITVDDIAGRAGVGKGTIYRYFKDKDDLFLQTAMSGFDELCELLAKTTNSAPFPEQLLRVCKRITEFFRKRRPLFRMMQSEEVRMHWCKGELRRRWTKHRASLATAVSELLRRGVADGVVRDDIAPEMLAGVLLSMLRAHARELSESLGESRSPRTIVDLFLRGAGAGPAEALTVNHAAATANGDGQGGQQ